MEQLKELVELAKNATPGKWRRSSTVFNGITATPFSLEFRKEDMLAHCPEKRDALFISAANPQTILAIAEAFRMLEQEKEAAEAKLAKLADMVPDEHITYATSGEHLAFSQGFNTCRDAILRKIEVLGTDTPAAPEVGK